MARPTVDVDATPVVVAKDGLTGETVAWCGGEFYGTPRLATVAQMIADGGGTIRMGHALYPVDAHTPAGAAAAMLGACGGHATLTENSYDPWPDDDVFVDAGEWAEDPDDDTIPAVTGDGQGA